MGEETAPASQAPLDRLRRRTEFLQVARGTRVHLAGFTVQAAKRPAANQAVGDSDAALSHLRVARVGLTVTKKTGDAVERNRIRRRLREALRHAKALSTEPDTDYVVVARRDVLTLSFERLIGDLETAMRKVGVQLGRPGGSGKHRRRAGST